MKLCSVLIQSCLFISFSLLVYYSDGHEHHNQIDPAAKKYSQSTINVDSADAATVKKNNFQQLNDDENLQDTIESRLRTKHNLRQSVHHSNENENLDEDEQEYIDRLNSALDDERDRDSDVEDSLDQEPQYDAPPTVEKVYKKSSKNKIPDEVQPSSSPSKTRERKSSSTTTPPPSEHQRKSVIDGSLSIEEQPKPKSNLDKTKPPVILESSEGQPVNIDKQKVIKEEVQSNPAESLSSASSRHEKEAVNTEKLVTDKPSSFSDSKEQQQNIETVRSHGLKDKRSIDDKVSSAAPLQSEQSRKHDSHAVKKANLDDIKSAPETKSNENLSDLHLKEQKMPDVKQKSESATIKTDHQQAIPNIPTIDVKSNHESVVKTADSSELRPDRQQVVTENISKDRPLDINLKPQETFDTKQNVDLPNINANRQEPVINNTASDLNLKQHQTIDKVENLDSSEFTKGREKASPEVISKDHSAHSNTKQEEKPLLNNPSLGTISQEQQQQIINNIQSTKSLDPDPSITPPTIIDKKQPVTDSVKEVIPSNEQQLHGHTAEDEKRQKSEKILNSDSTDHTKRPVQADQQADISSTTRSTQSTPTNVKSDENLHEKKDSSATRTTTPPSSTRILRSASTRTTHTTRTSERRSDHAHSHEEPIKTQQEPETVSKTQEPTIQPTASTTTITNVETAAPTTVMSSSEPVLTTTKSTVHAEPTLSSSTVPITESPPTSIVQESIQEHNHSTASSSFKSEEAHVEIQQEPSVPVHANNNDIHVEINKPNKQTLDTLDLPRQVHVHDPDVIREQLMQESNENHDMEQNKENSASVTPAMPSDQSLHLPRIIESEEKASSIDGNIETLTHNIQTIDNRNEKSQPFIHSESKIEEINNTLNSNSMSNITEKGTAMIRQLCWHLPKSFEPRMELIENQILSLAELLPDYVQAIFYGRVHDREKIINRFWFGSLCGICLLFSLIFISMGTKRLKQTKEEKSLRARCQQLQQYNNQIELERATFEKQNQELSDQIDELKKLPVSDADEELFEIREKYERIHADWKSARNELDTLQTDLDYKDTIIQKYEYDMQKQIENVAFLNQELLHYKQELEKDRETLTRLQSTDLSLERFEKLQETINDLKSEMAQSKQEKFNLLDQLEELQQRANKLDIANNELTIKMKQLKDLLAQRDETIAQIREKMLNSNDEEDENEKTTELTNLLATVTENKAENDQKELLSNINHDIEKANQHMKDLLTEIDEKARRIKEIDNLLHQEKDRCRELETKLKVVLELRERDAHLHIRQLGQTDAELRKARTDTERVRILQQQLDLKQKQLEDVQKVLTSEQTKFTEDTGKLQHEIHEKWMEVKRLTRELDGSRKECEGLRKQITKYANNERSSLEKTMHKPIPQHMNNTSRMSSEPDTNSSSPPPPPHPYQQGDNFRPIDHERNDSGATSPADMLRIRPPLFPPARVPFFPPPFIPPPPNPFMMGPRFPMPVGGPHGMISPIAHLMTNGSMGGSDANSFEIVDSVNITPNSTSYDTQLNGSAVSPVPNDEDQATAAPAAVKPKKPKKSTKKKSKTPATTTTPAAATTTAQEV